MENKVGRHIYNIYLLRPLQVPTLRSSNIHQELEFYFYTWGCKGTALRTNTQKENSKTLIHSACHQKRWVHIVLHGSLSSLLQSVEIFLSHNFYYLWLPIKSEPNTPIFFNAGSSHYTFLKRLQFIMALTENVPACRWLNLTLLYSRLSSIYLPSKTSILTPSLPMKWSVRPLYS